MTARAKPMPARGWSGDEDGWYPDAPPSIEVTCTEPTVLGVLYGPHGELLGTVVDREPVPFGFRAPESLA